MVRKKEQRTEAILGMKPVSKDISSKAAKTRKANSIKVLLKKKETKNYKYLPGKCGY